MADSLSKFFEDSEFRSTDFTGAASPENLFSILESLEVASRNLIPFSPIDESLFSPKGSDESLQTINTSQKSNDYGVVRPHETDEDDDEAYLARKKFRFSATLASSAEGALEKISHITVERNRRKQMNEHLTMLRSLMPSFYVKRGDQASIIGGVVDYIKELQQVLQSLEAKKQRKAYSEVLSPRSLVSSPRPRPHSPRPSPLSPRIALPVSPRTPQPTSPLKPRNIQPPYNNNNNNLSSSHNSSPISLDSSTDQPPAANSKSPVADVEVKFSGPNVLLNTVSHRFPGQTTKIISALEGHSLEILHVDINTIDDTMLNSFTIKIGIECELSAEELAQEILQTFA